MKNMIDIYKSKLPSKAMKVLMLGCREIEKLKLDKCCTNTRAIVAILDNCNGKGS